mmetsp:Transcript_6478/g.21669  ORF Transcript_6478/g.21669 Transcript_6478/m.21669 type:complete len:238 (+) Transcript_6478:706-1419(+)
MLHSNPVSSAGPATTSVCVCGSGRPVTRRKVKYPATRNIVAITAPVPKLIRYSRPFTSLLAYLSGVMNDPFAMPTYVAHAKPVANCFEAVALFVPDPPYLPLPSSSAIKAASSSSEADGLLSRSGELDRESPLLLLEEAAATPAIPSAMSTSASKAIGVERTGSPNTYAPHTNETKMESPDQSACAIERPAFWMATMASVPLPTQMAAPTTPHHVHLNGTNKRANHAETKHAVVLKH